MQEWQGRKREPVTEERLVRAVEVLAEIVKQHGPAYGPLYDAVERELMEFRRQRQSHKVSIEPQRGKRARRVA